MRGALAVADKRLGDATPRTFKAICEAAEPVLRQAVGRQAQREHAIVPDQSGARRGASTPGYIADLTHRKSTPAKTLLRHGIIAPYPMPASTRSEQGRRYQSTVPGCWSIVWDGSTWTDPEVEAIRRAVLDQAAIEAGRRALPGSIPFGVAR